MQKLDLFNELYIIEAAYFLILFSDFVSNPESKYKIGQFYTNNLLLVGLLNILVALFEMTRAIKFKIRKAYFNYRWKKFNRI